MKAKEVLKMYDITRVTLSRWVKSGRISYEKLPSGRYDYRFKNHNPLLVNGDSREVVLYCRVSTSGQKDNLLRQVERLKSFASSKGHVVNHVYSEIASALNYNRKQYRKLYKDVVEGKIKTIISEYKDRLLRIGFDDFNELCKLHNVEIIIIDESLDKSKQKEIVDDMISIIHHFSDRMYSSRRNKKIETLVSEIMDENA